MPAWAIKKCLFLKRHTSPISAMIHGIRISPIQFISLTTEYSGNVLQRICICTKMALRDSSNGNFDRLGVRKRWDTVLSKDVDFCFFSFVAVVSHFLCLLVTISGKSLFPHIEERLKMNISIYEFSQLMVSLLHWRRFDIPCIT